MRKWNNGKPLSSSLSLQLFKKLCVEWLYMYTEWRQPFQHIQQYTLGNDIRGYIFMIWNYSKYYKSYMDRAQLLLNIPISSSYTHDFLTLRWRPYSTVNGMSWCMVLLLLFGVLLFTVSKCLKTHIMYAIQHPMLKGILPDD